MREKNCALRDKKKYSNLCCAKQKKPANSSVVLGKRDNSQLLSGGFT